VLVCHADAPESIRLKSFAGALMQTRGGRHLRVRKGGAPGRERMS